MHWSVDFVEHLRTVHFALVTASAVLLLLAFGNDDKHIAVARTQATEISELHDLWPDVRSSMYEQAARGASVSTADRFYRLAFAAPKSMSSTAGVVIEIRLPGRPKTFPSWRFAGPQMAEPPRTLVQFQTWWSAVQRGTRVQVSSIREAPAQCDVRSIRVFTPQPPNL